MRLWNNNTPDDRLSPDQGKDQPMEHDTNTFNKRRKVSAKSLPLYVFAALILAAVLLCAASAKDVSSLLSNLDRLASILLKAALTYFFFEGAKFLCRHRKQPPRRPVKERGNMQKAAAPAAAEPPDDQAKSISAQPVPEPQARQTEEPKLPDSCPSENVPPGKEPVYGHAEERIPAPQPICFDFQDTVYALDIIDGKCQGPIFLVPADKGLLMGVKNKKGSYLTSLNEEYLTETDLRYSPVATCFEITGLARVRQKAKVRCDRPAVLTEVENGLYEITEKGQLTVVTIIE